MKKSVFVSLFLLTLFLPLSFSKSLQIETDHLETSLSSSTQTQGAICFLFDTPESTPKETPITGPSIVLNGEETLTIPADFYFTDPGYVAYDYLGNDITDRVIQEGEIIPYLVGTYELTYTVTDDLSQTARAVRTVCVVPVELPDIVDPPEKTVYLTFDDGPCNNTEKLLDILKKYDVKATFFIVGSKGHKDLIARAYQEGHSIGVHCFRHEFNEIYANEQAYFADFLKAQEIVKEITGSYTHIFRFPGGSANTVSYINKGLMTRLTKIMEDRGYRYFDWNVCADDVGSVVDFTTIDIERRLKSGIQRHQEYAIVLQHDISYLSICAVDEVIRWGLEKGYTFLPLDLTSPVLHSVVQN